MLSTIDALTVHIIFGKALTEPIPEYTITDVIKRFGELVEPYMGRTSFQYDPDYNLTMYLRNHLNPKIGNHVPLSRLVSYAHNPDSYELTMTELVDLDDTKILTWLGKTSDDFTFENGILSMNSVIKERWYDRVIDDMSLTFNEKTNQYHYRNYQPHYIDFETSLLVEDDIGKEKLETYLAHGLLETLYLSVPESNDFDGGHNYYDFEIGKRLESTAKHVMSILSGKRTEIPD